MVVLLVDDDEDCRRIYRIALEHAGYRVLTAMDGRDGLRVALSEKPDVVLLDLAMPVIDGYMALQRLRAAPATRGLPIVAITAHASEHDVEEFLAQGFDGLLVKPVSPREVIDAVGGIVSRERALRGTESSGEAPVVPSQPAQRAPHQSH